jgi:hypothetical protein
MRNGDLMQSPVPDDRSSPATAPDNSLTQPPLNIRSRPMLDGGMIYENSNPGSRYGKAIYSDTEAGATPEGFERDLKAHGSGVNFDQLNASANSFNQENFSSELPRPPQQEISAPDVEPLTSPEEYAQAMKVINNLPYGRPGDKTKRESMLKAAGHLIDLGNAAVGIGTSNRDATVAAHKTGIEQQNWGQEFTENRRVKNQELDIDRQKIGAEGDLTRSQETGNAEIDAARQAVSGMDRETVRRKTQQYTDTGRENSDYDPFLDGLIKKATNKKYGTDPSFQSIYKKFFGKQSSVGGVAPAGYPNAKQALDGNWYVEKDGKWFRVEG